MDLVPAPAVRLMKRRVLSRPGVNSSRFPIHRCSLFITAIILERDRRGEREGKRRDQRHDEQDFYLIFHQLFVRGSVNSVLKGETNIRCTALCSGPFMAFAVKLWLTSGRLPVVGSTKNDSHEEVSANRKSLSYNSVLRNYSQMSVT